MLAGGDSRQVPTVVLTDPVRFAAREAKAWSPKLGEAEAEAGERRAGVVLACPDLVESVNEERLSRRDSWWILDLQEIVRRDRGARLDPQRLDLVLEGGRLPGPGIGQQDVGVMRPEVGERTRIRP
ncbi:MAG: hypothetical protein OXI71_17425 [Gemmatimonadota bacterium]|nr:hypothetical protein [Gemmatimonadota bacterium]